MIKVVTMSSILNLTQHVASPEQLAEGVVELAPEYRAKLSRLLTVDDLPTREEIENRCKAIAALVYKHDSNKPPTACMIGGAPWMMGPLVQALRNAGVTHILAAFSKRESVEQAQPDGSVRKVAVFRHAGFVEC